MRRTLSLSNSVVILVGTVLLLWILYIFMGDGVGVGLGLGLESFTTTNTNTYDDSFCKEMEAQWRKVESFMDLLTYAKKVLTNRRSRKEDVQQVTIEIIPSIKDQYNNEIKPILEHLQKMYKTNREALRRDAISTKRFYSRQNYIKNVIKEMDNLALPIS